MTSSEKVKSIAYNLVKTLMDKGFAIQRYDAYKTCSVYLKLDYGVCNTIRISDHQGKQHLNYRYNLIIGGNNNITDETYMRYYFNEDTVDGLVNQILFDRMSKVNKYGKQNYIRYMSKNRADNASNSEGFWKNAKIIHDPHFGKTSGNTVVGIQIPKSRPGGSSTHVMRQMCDGSYAYGPSEVLHAFNKSIAQQDALNASSQFPPGTNVRVIASLDELTAYFESGDNGEPHLKAKSHAMIILGNGTGEVLGTTDCPEGRFYTIEMETEPMVFLPETFLTFA